MPRQLTDDEIRELATRLRGTNGHVYRLAEQMFPGCETDDATFERLESVAGLFKCVECNSWKDIADERDDAVDTMCTDCVAEIDADNNEEDTDDED